MDILAKDQMNFDYMRIKSIPFHYEVIEFLHTHDRIFIVELNRDGQLAQLLTLEAPEESIKFRNVTKVDGLPLTAKWIANEIRKDEEI